MGDAEFEPGTSAPEALSFTPYCVINARSHLRALLIIFEFLKTEISKSALC